MKIVAITKENNEFCYSLNSVYGVSARSADLIRDSLNAAGYKLKPGEKWHVYTVDKYDNAYDVATYQYMRLYRDKIKIYG